MFSWVVKVVPQPPEPPGDEEPQEPPAPVKKVTIQEARPEPPPPPKEEEPKEENGQAGMLTWISNGIASALPQPAGSKDESKPEEDVGMIQGIVQMLGKVVPQPEPREEVPEPPPPRTIDDVPVVEVESEPEPEPEEPPTLIEWIKQGIEKVVPQPEPHEPKKAPAPPKVAPPPEPPKPAEEDPKERNVVGWIVQGFERMLPQPVSRIDEGSDDVQNICIKQATADMVLEDVDAGGDQENQEEPQAPEDAEQAEEGEEPKEPEEPEEGQEPEEPAAEDPEEPAAEDPEEPGPEEPEEPGPEEPAPEEPEEPAPEDPEEPAPEEPEEPAPEEPEEPAPEEPAPEEPAPEEPEEPAPEEPAPEEPEKPAPEEPGEPAPEDPGEARGEGSPCAAPQVKDLIAEDAETQTERWSPLMESIKNQAEKTVLAKMEERLQQERLEAVRLSEQIARHAAEMAVRRLEEEQANQGATGTPTSEGEQCPGNEERPQDSSAFAAKKGDPPSPPRPESPVTPEPPETVSPQAAAVTSQPGPASSEALPPARAQEEGLAEDGECGVPTACSPSLLQRLPFASEWVNCFSKLLHDNNLSPPKLSMPEEFTLITKGLSQLSSQARDCYLSVVNGLNRLNPMAQHTPPLTLNP